MSTSSIFRRLFSSKPRTYRHPKAARQSRLAIDTLENRECPAVVSAGTLVIEGSNGTDTVYVTQTIPANIWEISKVQVNHNGVIQTFSKSLIRNGVVQFRGYGGNDIFQNSAFLYVNADGGSGADVLSGGPMDDTLMGGTNNDAIYGNDGVDQIWGGQGNDELRGGAGNDTLNGDIDQDTMRGGPGSDILYGGDGHDTMYGDNNAGTAGGYGADSLYGGLGNDTMAGEGGSDYMQGGGNMDWLYGNDGHDTMYGDNAGVPGVEANDFLFGGSGWDTLYGDAGSDYMRGEGDPDVLFGGPGHDTMYGDNAGSTLDGESDDELYGNWGNDTLFGEGANDLLYGEGDNDVLNGGYGHDEMLGGDGYDHLYGGYGNDTLRGENGEDLLFGEFNNDALYGGSDFDRLDGGEGLDGLFGGIGEAGDQLTGGPGADRLLSAPYEDVLVDRASEDAFILLATDGSAAWSNEQVELIDKGIGWLHTTRGDTALLRAPGENDGLDFDSVMTIERIQSLGGVAVMNNNSNGRIRVADDAFATNIIQTADVSIVHEFGHNFDVESPVWDEWLGLSGWEELGWWEATGRQVSLDGDWTYDVLADFARMDTVNTASYGRTNPREDWCTYFETAYINQTFAANSPVRNSYNFGVAGFETKLDLVERFIRWGY